MAFKTPTSKQSQRTQITTTRAEQFTPITVSQNELNRLTPAGSVVSVTPLLAPNDRRLDDTGRNVIRPTPVGKP
jgi:hypothetical protein